MMDTLIMNALFLIVILGIPLSLLGWNLWTLFRALKYKDVGKVSHIVGENIIIWVSILLGLFLYGLLVIPVDWHVQLNNAEVHNMIHLKSLPTLLVIMSLSYISYLFLRIVETQKQAPLLSSIAIAGIYLGIFMSILWVVQVISNLHLALVGINLIVTYVKSIVIFICLKEGSFEVRDDTVKLPWLKKIFQDATNLPLTGLALALPLLGLVIIILMLFGQEPSSVIKAWTETADWTLSQKVPPQNIQFDDHYLCTVAAGGHPKVVKPLRTGVRHKKRIVVNRQLCIANAFEQVIQDKLPLAHKNIRSFYDATAYPISKHIHSHLAADLIYYLMKPLEWFFLIVLYAVDAKPEDRIAVQYPHQPIHL